MSKLSHTAALLLGVLTLTSAPIAAAQTAHALVQDVHTTTGASVAVPLGKSRVIRLPVAFRQVVLARPATADVHVLSSRSFYVYGKAVGSTNVLLLDGHNQPVAMVDLEVGFDIDGIQSTVNTMLPGQQIGVRAVPNGVIMTGTANDAASAAQALAIADRYAPNAVTNAMSVRGPQQVVLEVRFLEADRNVGRELGLNTFIHSGNFSIATGVHTPGSFSNDGLASGRSAFGAMRFLNDGRSLIDVQLDALEERGVVHMLAEPNLAALSGDTATFLAGGEFPIPVAAANNTITVEFKQFGVALAFTPTVLADGRINLRVSTEVSQLDENHGVRVERIQIPSLVVRRSATTIELNDGQSMAMAGLIQSNYTTNRTQVPWAADVPVLGALFASTRFERNQTELVVVVTPRLSSAVGSQSSLAAPFSSHAAPSDPELFLGGVTERPTAPPPVSEVPSTAQSGEHVSQAAPQAQSAEAVAPAAEPTLDGAAAEASATGPMQAVAANAPAAAATSAQPRSWTEALRDFLHMRRPQRPQADASAQAAPTGAGETPASTQTSDAGATTRGGAS
ncbi:MAG: type II and III secretion system protein family protein [Proteobacteria bacterium]|nr:type II and III secretion system protein family protein [Pseudomonadota bacterium]